MENFIATQSKINADTSSSIQQIQCHRLKILNFNLPINYSEFSIQICNPLIIHVKPSLILKSFPIL